MKRISVTKVIWIAARLLRVHPEAQRVLVPKKLKKLMAQLDLDAIGVLHGVEYEVDGRRVIQIIDGQHRWEALMRLGLGDWEVQVAIHPDVTNDATASKLFLELNDRAPVQPLCKFRNEVQAGVPSAVGAVRIIEDRGLTIGPGSTEGQVCCVAALKRTYERDEGKTLAMALDTLIGAWGRTNAAMEGQLIEGLAVLHATYDGKIDQPALIKKLAKFPGGASGVLGKARGLREIRKRPVPRCVAEVIADVYNVARRTKLDLLP